MEQSELHDLQMMQSFLHTTTVKAKSYALMQTEAVLYYMYTELNYSISSIRWLLKMSKEDSFSYAEIKISSV